jgi:hypothetical protein
MKVKGFVFAICFLLLGIAIGFYLARKVWLPAKVIAMTFTPVGEMLVEANKGDRLEWFSGPSQPAPVTVKFGFKPCGPGSDPGQGTCTLTDSAIYHFNCAAAVCQDPGWGGGNDTFQEKLRAQHVAAVNPPLAMPGPATVNVYCDPATSTAKADATVTGHKGEAFTMLLNGPGNDFTATFTTNPCDVSNPLNGGNPNCRITPTVTTMPMDYPYTLTVGGCMNPGSAKITEIPTP